MDKNLDLNTSGNLPQSDASFADAGGPGSAKGDLRRGYTSLDSDHELYPMYGPYCMSESCEDNDGSTYNGDYAAKGGFLNRPTGRER